MAVQLSQRFVYVQKSHLDRQLIILFFALAASPVIVAIVDERFWQTLLLWWGVTVVGLMLITRLSRRLRDPNLQKLGYVFLIKLLLVLFLLFFGWRPDLDPYASSSRMDVQLYYFRGYELALSGFSLSALPPLNYTGILFYYAAIFAAFGHNPVAPALVNVFVTLLATLLLVRVGYQIKRRRDPRDWILGLCMIIPEVLFYDTLTSRETLVMSMIVISVLSVAVYFTRKPGDPFSPRQVVAAMLAILLIAVIRTTLLIPVIGSLLLFLVGARIAGGRRSIGLVLIGLAMVIFLLAPLLAENLGSTPVDYAYQIDFVGRSESARSSTKLSWSEESVGRLFIADNLAEAIMFIPIRLLFYLVTPLPDVLIDLTGLIGREWSAWKHLMALMSSALYLVVLPLVVASLFEAIRKKKWVDELAFHIPFWLTVVAISSGTLIIHVRYRIMFVPLLWGCVWLGRTCDQHLIRRVYVGWFGVLLAGGAIFLAYKHFL